MPVSETRIKRAGDPASRQVAAMAPYGPPEGSSRVRIAGWAPYTDARIDILPYTTRAASKRFGKSLAVPRAEARRRRQSRARNDIALVSREASPVSRGRLEQEFFQNASHGVFDLDDAVHLPSRHAPFRAQRAAVAAASASVVVAGNTHLADWASHYNQEVVIIPSCIDPLDYDMKSTFELHDPPVVGWLGSHSTERYLATISEALLELHRQLGVKLLLLSVSTGGLGALEVMVEREPWSMERQRPFGDRVDLGIMPLPDDPWSRGKCGYKLLQYAAAGIPSIASPIGANVSIARETGAVLASNISEWIGAINSILDQSAETRRTAGRSAFEAAVGQFSYSAWSAAWSRAVLG